MVYQEVIFTKDECDTIINYKDKYHSFLVTPEWSVLKDTRTVYHEVQIEKSWVKKYNVWDVPINEETFWFYDRIYSWFINVSGVKIDKEIYFKTEGAAHKLHEYQVGDKFDLHIDRNEDNLDRIWNLGIQLNSGYVGGDYVCYNQNNEEIHISKKIGNVVAYTSDTLHEIKEITDGVRYSMVIKLHSWELIKKDKKTLL